MKLFERALWEKMDTFTWDVVDKSTKKGEKMFKKDLELETSISFVK